MFILVSVLLTWLIFAFAYQFYTPLRRIIARNTLTVFAILPNWQLFSPAPIQGYYEIHYRCFNPSNEQEERWIKYDYIGTKKIYSWLYNPDANIIKCITSICFSVKNYYTDNNAYYLLLLNKISSLSKDEKAKDDKSLVQFRINWVTGETNRPIFTSLIHELD